MKLDCSQAVLGRERIGFRDLRAEQGSLVQQVATAVNLGATDSGRVRLMRLGIQSLTRPAEGREVLQVGPTRGLGTCGNSFTVDNSERSFSPNSRRIARWFGTAPGCRVWGLSQPRDEISLPQSLDGVGGPHLRTALPRWPRRGGAWR